MGLYLKQQWVGYFQIIIIVVTDNTRLGVTVSLLPRLAGDSTMQGVEGKGRNEYRQFW